MKFHELFEAKSYYPDAVKRLRKQITAKWKKYGDYEYDPDTEDEELKNLENEGEFLDNLEFDKEKRVVMYRAMVVPGDFLKQLFDGKSHSLGRHWASQKNEARVYSYHGPKENMHQIVLCVSIDFNDIYYDASVERVQVGEFEILPQPEADLKLKAVWLDGNEIQLPPSLPMMFA